MLEAQQAGMTTRRQKIKIILALAVPTMIENFLLTIVGFIDTLFVSRIGLNEVAAVGVGNTVIAVYIALFTALGIGTSSLIARAVGAGDFTKAKAIARQSTWISAFAGLALGIVSLFFAEPILHLMGAAPDVLAQGVIYFQIVAVPSLFISLMAIFGSILRSAGNTRAPMIVGIWVNLIHIVLDYVLIFGIGGWEGWGIAGAGWATSIVRVIGTVVLYKYIQQSKLSFSLFKKQSSQNYTYPLLNLSLPAAAERLIMRVGQMFYLGLVIRISTEVYAAHLIAGNVIALSYLPGYGLAVAATTLVGQQLGAGRTRDSYEYGLLTAWIAVVFMTIIGIVFWLGSGIAASWFTEDIVIVEMVRTALGIDAFAQPFLAMSLVLAGALQGAGDTKSPMYSTIIGIWGIRVLGIYVLCLHFQMGIAGVWLVSAIDQLVRSIYLMQRFKSRMNAKQTIAQVE
ncbi:MATE family efflux transporter [Paenibacillus sp. BIHB 4019]|uniref:Probable multidrug resistance protein NorM n=1 Tax=Paenibacillus sp. BIHB 4019 TaxID=1870819 RepID=A0A1B2DFU5_9BACL|nr:MATE family efflux transporter [Paenibacillus sp. BIHB 4019]ANY66587.1 MATE family efflux transporter [Paenibacillus sp. BIHB 4019]